MYTIIDKNKSHLWNEIIQDFGKRDIYFTYEFFLSSLLLDEGEPLLFYYEDEYGKVAYPFVKRKIIHNNDLFFDITTPYGYGGPIISAVKNKEELIKRFRREFVAYCTENKIVSEFIRFHPLLENHLGLDIYLETVYVRDTISMPLTNTENLLMNLPGKTRNMVRKASKNGVIIKKIDAFKSIPDFLSIYHSTMSRNEADNFYYFEKEYFHDTITLLGSNVQMFGAFFEGKMISATLILIYGEFIHYHLSGSLKEYLSLGANNLLLYKVAEWATENGYKNFHLGGGYSGKDDSLYRFKKSFTNSDPLNFYIGKKIHDRKTYYELAEKKQIIEDNGYFPLYRS